MDRLPPTALGLGFRAAAQRAPWRVGPPGRRTRFAALLFAALAGSSFGCSSLPGRALRLEPPPAGGRLEPAAPAHVVWLRIASARVPERDRSGRLFDEGGLPDPFVILWADGRQLLRSSVAADTLEPVWQGGASGNFSLPRGSKLRVQVLDSDGPRSETIADAELDAPSLDDAHGGVVELAVGPSTRVRLQIEPARALYGMGFQYRFRQRICEVMGVYQYGPAARAGVRVGDRIVQVGGEPVRGLSAHALRARFDAPPVDGLEVQLLHAGGTSETVRLAEGPVYPLWFEHGPMP